MWRERVPRANAQAAVFSEFLGPRSKAARCRKQEFPLRLRGQVYDMIRHYVNCCA